MLQTFSERFQGSHAEENFNWCLSNHFTEFLSRDRLRTISLKDQQFLKKYESKSDNLEIILFETKVSTAKNHEVTTC